MSDFNRDRRGGGGRDFKRRDFGSGGSDRPQVMHKTICSNCGKECEVPFRPNGSKPVFCRDCFQNNRSSDSRGSDNYERRPSFNDRNNNPVPRQTEQPQYKEQFEILNTKMDKILNLLSIKEPVKTAEINEPSESPVIEVPIIRKKRVSKK